MKKFLSVHGGKILIVLLIANLAIWILILSRVPGRFLKIYFLDVGQGDAELIKSPEGQTMLIDGGPDEKILEKLGKYLPPLCKKIDIVLLTHPHTDHAAGLVEVLKRYDVGLVILNGAYLKTGAYDQFLAAVKNSRTKVLTAAAGTAIHFGSAAPSAAGAAEFDIISPAATAGAVFNQKSESFGAAGNDVNDTSIVGKFFYKNFSSLLTGDATSKIENIISAEYGDRLKSGVLKVGHHGSKYASSTAFLKLVSSKAAIIEVGAKNRYGLPSPAALSRLQLSGAKIFRTDEDGDIEILTDGFSTEIFKEK